MLSRYFLNSSFFDSDYNIEQIVGILKVKRSFDAREEYLWLRHGGYSVFC